MLILYILLVLFALIVSMVINALITYIPAKFFYDSELQAHEVLAPVAKKKLNRPMFKLSFPLTGLFSMKLNWQSLLVDLLVISYVLFVYFCIGFSFYSILIGFFGLSLILLSVIDANYYILPDMVTLPLLWLGLLLNAYMLIMPLRSAVLGAILGYLILWLVYHGFKLVTGKEGMGYGDFKLLAAIGAWFGVGAVVYVMLFSALVGIALGMVLRLFDKSISVLPFGMALSLGWLLYFVFLHKSYVLIAF